MRSPGQSSVGRRHSAAIEKPPRSSTSRSRLRDKREDLDDSHYLVSRRKGSRDFLDEFDEEEEEEGGDLQRRRANRRKEEWGSRRTLVSPEGDALREWGSRRALRSPEGGRGRQWGSRQQMMEEEWEEEESRRRRRPVGRASSQAGYDRLSSAADRRRNSFQATDIPSPRYVTVAQQTYLDRICNDLHIFAEF
jgi:hypothetical protein